MPTELSVVMAVYNGERFLEEAVQSVLNQTYPHFELLIVDDGSTDRSGAILSEFARRDARVVIVRQENRGISRSLNRALELAKNSLVAHIDADDRALPQWLEKQLAFLEKHPECSVVSSYAYFINTAGKRFGKSQNPVDVERGKRELNPSCFLEVIHSTVLVRRDDLLSVGGYRQISAEDRDLWGRVVTAGFMIRCNPEPLVEYRLHGTSETTKKLDRQTTFARRGIDMNVVRRLRGERELEWFEVEQWYKDRPVSAKVKEFRRVTAGVNYRLAARHFSERRWWKLMVAFGVAALMRPVWVISRAVSKMGA